MPLLNAIGVIVAPEQMVCDNGVIAADGFGLTSTQNRLQLLFGEKANFTIKEINGNTVEAKVILPVAAVA